MAVHASVSPARFHDYRTEKRGWAESRARLLQSALADASLIEEEVRFVTLTAADTIVRGAHGEYRYEEDPFDQGGFAYVYRARDSAGRHLVLKRLHARDDEAVARLRREIQEQRRIAHPSVMPVVDADPDYRWFVMPRADENLAERFHAGPIDDAHLLEILRSVAEGLAAAHKLGLVHRDVSPRNILRVGDRWVVADWGVVRRPPGLTTMVRTQGELGTNGFAAPELFREAHQATSAADVYALGRIAAWAVTRKWPDQNVPLMPEGPWRRFVQSTAQYEIGRRATDMAAVLELLADVERACGQASASVEELESTLTGEQLLERCLARPDDEVLYRDRLHTVSREALDAWVEQRTADVEALVLTMERHLLDPDVDLGRNFEPNSRTAWFRLVAQLAEARARLGLLEDAASALLRADGRWHRFAQRQATRAWIERQRGDAAATVARAVAAQREGADWLLEEGWWPSNADARIRAAFDALASNPPGRLAVPLQRRSVSARAAVTEARTIVARAFSTTTRGRVFRFRATDEQVERISRIVSDHNVRTGHAPDSLVTLYADEAAAVDDHNRTAAEGDKVPDWPSLLVWLKQDGDAYDVEDLMNYIASDGRGTVPSAS